MQAKLLERDGLRVEFFEEGPYRERVSARVGGEWRAVLESAAHATVPRDERSFAIHYQDPTATSVAVGDGQARIVQEHPDYAVERTVRFSAATGVLDIDVALRAKKDLLLRSLEDIWNFLPPRRDGDTPLSGPLDFVWSQRLKSVPAGFIPHNSFRTPAVMLQQGPLFAAILAGLEGVDAASLERVPLGMDLNVTTDKSPWFSYGAISSVALKPDWPCEAGHSQIVRGRHGEFLTIRAPAGETLRYRYSLMVTQEPEKAGYRHAQRYLWDRYGAPVIRSETALPDNVRFPGCKTLRSWREELWDNRAAGDFFCYEKQGRTVGGITGRRQGEWFSRTSTDRDLWFASWLHELVTGYGMHLYGGVSGQAAWRQRTRAMLDAILLAPRQNGMFPVICYCETDGGETWLKDDGWAGFREEYHAWHMSFTGWLMLRWGRSVHPEKWEEILAFCRPYGEFLLRNQHGDGCIPSWYGDDGLPSRKQLRDFNAETVMSALFLMELGQAEGERFLQAGLRAMDFMEQQVLPRQRWFDLETFLSCSQKDFSFYDGITAQYPQCNLSMIWGAAASLLRYRITREAAHLETARRVLDYTLLSQQLWNHPALKIKPFGGFNVQNGDNEWSDVREAWCAMLLCEYFLETGEVHYLERAVAARHAGFEVLPYENWAHCGYEGIQYDSSLLWGGGVVITAAEYLDDRLGSAVLLVRGTSAAGYGADSCVVREVSCRDGRLCATIDCVGHEAGAPLTLRVFSDTGAELSVAVNGVDVGVWSPAQPEAKLHWSAK